MAHLKTGQRILAIDFGTVRIGVALSDPTLIIASALDTYANSRKIQGVIRDLIAEHDVGMVVVGMPVNLKGKEERKAGEVRVFIGELQRTITVPIRTWDERFTSIMAKQSMIDMGLRKRQRQEKGRVDRMAAALLLQNFLDARAYNQPGTDDQDD